MNTDRLAQRTLSLAMAAVFTASTLVGIDLLAANQHASSDLMARATAASAPRG